MKNLSENEILDMVKEGAEVLDGQGSFVVPFKFEREKPKPKQNRFGMYLGQIIATMREALEEKKATRAVLEKIAAGVQKLPAKESREKESEPARTVDFVIVRDAKGRIEKITATRRD